MSACLPTGQEPTNYRLPPVTLLFLCGSLLHTLSLCAQVRPMGPLWERISLQVHPAQRHAGTELTVAIKFILSMVLLASLMTVSYLNSVTIYYV